MIRNALICILFLLLINRTIAQERCGITYLDNRNYQDNKFENWIQKTRKLAYRTENQNYVIPVVVHIIHNGEAIGTPQNLSVEKVLEQIDILNADFRRTNADTINTSDIFKDRAADTGISFQLAKQDPEGLPTNGITRTRGNSQSYLISDDRLLKSNISWPQEDYLNIYVAELRGFLGWAQFPVANIDGLDGEFDPNAETDGVVIDYAYWGINPETGGSFESFGRTATHEVGHFLGLRHIWGDGGCSVDDFCDDTPIAESSTNGCPGERITCGSRNMIENYMDFTNDVCMNMFSTDQTSRMQIILNNSPRRKSLLSSKALEEPVRFSNDLGIRDYSFLTGTGNCNSHVTPLVTVRNYGTNTISNFELGLYVNDQLIETAERNFSLSPLSVSTYAFSPFEGILGETYDFEVRIENIGSVTDENPDNNSKSDQLLIAETTSIPYTESFDEFPVNRWQVNNNSLWQIGNAAFETVEDTGIILPYFNSNEAIGSLDYLISPSFKLDNADLAAVSFRYAYAQNSGEFTDGLILAVSTDCGQTFPESNYVFSRFGRSLETTSTLSQEFFPISSKDWETVSFDLSGYIGVEIKLALIGHNGNGNNIFVDEFKIGTSGTLTRDATIQSTQNLSIASCNSVAFPSLEIRNEGLNLINEIDIAVVLDGNTIGILKIDNLSIRSGRSELVELPIDLTNNNFETISFEIRSVNNLIDENALNNVFSTNVLTDTTRNIIPIREDFETDIRQFNRVSTSGESDWTETNIAGNNLIYSANFSQSELGKENWLVSPNFTVSDLSEGSLTFDLAYAQRNNTVDGLKVLLSKDCGINWNDAIFNKRGSELATVAGSVNTEWFPSSEADWITETIDLTEFIDDVFTNEIRIAFVTTNGNGNNIFLDNIQLFDTRIPNLLDIKGNMTVFPNPSTGTFFVAMDLPQREEIALRIIDISGKQVRKFDLVNVLNQRYEINIPQTKGVYFVQAIGKNTNLTRRILIGR